MLLNLIEQQTTQKEARIANAKRKVKSKSSKQTLHSKKLSYLGTYKLEKIFVSIGQIHGANTACNNLIYVYF